MSVAERKLQMIEKISTLNESQLEIAEFILNKIEKNDSIINLSEYYNQAKKQFSNTLLKLAQ